MLWSAGCVSYGPSGNAEFQAIESLEQLEGVYRNLGVSEEGQHPQYLSAIIWPRDEELDHAAIDTVEVRVPGRGTLTVRGLGTGGVEKEGTFVEGEHFELYGGRIRLEHGLRVAGARLGEPVVGSAWSSRELGLDRGGHGKYQFRQGVAGLAYLVIPMAVGISTEVRFPRLNDLPGP